MVVAASPQFYHSALRAAPSPLNLQTPETPLNPEKHKKSATGNVYYIPIALLLYHLPKGDGIIPRGKSACHPWHPYGGLSSFRDPPAE